MYVHEVRDLFHMFHPNQLLLPEFVYRYDREINASSYTSSNPYDRSLEFKISRSLGFSLCVIVALPYFVCIVCGLLDSGVSCLFL